MLSMDKKAKKFVWYENPKYYLAAILMVWGFRLLLDTLHTLLPRVLKNLPLASNVSVLHIVV